MQEKAEPAAGQSVQRYYDQGVGRFLSIDPVGADSIVGGNFNRYWYANNSPYKFIDPDGRLSEMPLGGPFGRGRGQWWGDDETSRPNGLRDRCVQVCLNSKDAESGASEDSDDGPKGDLFTAVDVDLTAITGIEFSFGSVLDLDSIEDSGWYFSFSNANGANVGFGLGLGYVTREIEGKGAALDINAGKVSPTFLFDDKGLQGLSLTGGIGAGASGSIGTTWTLTPAKVLRSVGLIENQLDE